MQNKINRIIFLLALLQAGLSYSQHKHVETNEDSLYYYNSSLQKLDSLINLSFSKTHKDTSFYNSFSKSDNISLERLLKLTVLNNPELKVLQSGIEAIGFKMKEKSYLPDPMFEFELDDVMSDFKRVGMINFFVSQMFPFPGKLKLESQSVENSRSMMLSEKTSMTNELLAMVKMNYYDLYIIDRKLDVNKSSQLIMKTFITAAEAKYSVGKGMQQEVFKSQIEISRLSNEEFLLKQSKKNIFSKLSELTKITFDENTILIFEDVNEGYLLKRSSFFLTEQDANSLVDYAFEHRADLQTIKRKILMSKTELEMSKLERLPDFNLKLGYKVLPFEERNAFAFMVGFNIPFAPWSSGKYDYSVQKNEVLVKSSGLEYEAKRNEIRNEIVSLVNNLRSAQETMNYYLNIMMPQTENTLKATQYNYETGMTNFLDLLDSYKMFQEARLMYYESVMMYLKITAELEKATGMNLKN